MSDSSALPCHDWFEPVEYEARVERVRREMRTRGIDGLLLTSERNFSWLTGIQTPSFVSKTRPLTLVLPLEGEPTIVLAMSHTRHAATCSWVKDIRGFDGFEPEAIEAIADALRDCGLGAAAIGCELGTEQRLGLSWLAFERLRRKLPGARFVDGADVLWTGRRYKSPTEIGYLKMAGRITDAAFDAALGEVRAGLTELDVYRRFSVTCAELGAEPPSYFAMHSGRGNDTRPNRWPTDRVLETGDVIWIDAGTTYRGYWSDFTRMISIGDPDPARKAAYRFVHDTAAELLAAVRPGVTCASLMEIGRAAFERAGRAIGNATRMGHGLGLDLTEPPSIVDGDDTVLEPGMTIALEPGFRGDIGYFVVEENVVVTESGFDYLSVPAPHELPVA